MKNIIKKLNNEKGTSIVELLLAVSLFAMAILILTQIFMTVVESQKNSIAAQNTQENMRYVFEMMAKEIRTAQGAHTGIDCGQPGLPGEWYKVFNTSGTIDDMTGDELFFQNKNGQCVRYYTEVDANGINRIKIYRDLDKDNRDWEANDRWEFEYVTPDEVNVNNLLFRVIDDGVDRFHSTQPRVIINMEIVMDAYKPIHQKTINMQTTVSSRYYE